MDSYKDKEIKYITENYSKFSPDWYLRTPPDKDLRWKGVLPQMESRKRAAEKLPDWVQKPNLIFPSRRSVEQCSSQTTALWKQNLVQSFPGINRMLLTDLSGGFGVDCWFLAQTFEQANYVEQDVELFEIASHNFSELGGTVIHTHNCSAEAFLGRTNRIGGIAFIDPDRRNAQQQKLVALADCSPNVVELIPLLKQHFDAVLLKLSPMLDIQSVLSDLPNCHLLQVWAIQKECKELIALLDFTQPAPLQVPILARHQGDEDFNFTRESERKANCPIATRIATYLYEPNVAILKAGAFQSIGVQHQLEKLHPNSHLYTSETLLSDFPGRRFRVLLAFGFKSKEVKAALANIEACEITVRNFPLKAPEVRKRLQLKDGGHHTIFATTLNTGEHRLILCKKI